MMKKKNNNLKSYSSREINKMAKIDSILSKRILDFLNRVKDPAEIVNRIWYDPNAGKPSKKDYTIDPSLARRIMKERDRLPGQRFDSIEQLRKVPGVDSKVPGMHVDSLHNIIYSFGEIPLTGLSDLAKRVGIEGFLDFLPAGLSDVGKFTLTQFDSTFNTSTQSNSSVSLILRTDNWKIIPEKLNLSEVNIYLNIAKAEGPNLVKITGKISGKIKVGGVTIPVILQIPDMNQNNKDRVIIDQSEIIDWIFKMDIGESVSLNNLRDLFELEGGVRLMEAIPVSLAEKKGPVLIGFELQFPRTRDAIFFVRYSISLNTWDIIPDLVAIQDSIIKIEIDLTGSEPMIKGNIEGNIQVETTEIPITIPLGDFDNRWTLRLNQGAEEKVLLPFSKFESLFGPALESTAGVLPLENIELSVLKMKFSMDMTTLISVTIAAEMEKKWPLMGNLSVTMKNLRIDIAYPLDEEKIKVTFKVGGLVQVTSITLRALIEIYYRQPYWTLTILPPGDARSVTIPALSQLTDLLTNETMQNFLSLFPINVFDLSIDFFKLVIRFDKESNAVQSLYMDIILLNTNINFKTPYSNTYPDDKLEVNINLGKTSIALNFVDEEQFFKSEATISFSNLPELLNGPSDSPIQWTFPADFKVEKTLNTDTSIGVTVRDEFTFDVPNFEFANVEMNVSILVKGLSIYWGYPTITSNFSAAFTPDIVEKILGFPILNDQVEVQLDFDNQNGLNLQLLSWPFSIPETCLDNEGWTHVLFGNNGDLAEVKVKLPRFLYDGNHFKAKGEMSLIRLKSLEIPLDFVKNFLTGAL